ncbi:MAG: hypothetical protein LBH13_00395 [Cellulomonadaceae bacterium]|jgi:hypothetical protein|nr:hypothetical protein [Cellulomonadaceae bacterium]
MPEALKPTDPPPVEFTPITTQEAFDKALGSRLAHERAKFGDYDELKAKAAQFDQAEEASKSEAQKAADKISKLQQALAAEKHSGMRARIQAKHSISDEDAALFLTGTDEATVTAQAERLAATVTASPQQPAGPTGPVIPGVSKTPEPPVPDEATAAARALFGTSDATT